MLTMMFDDDHQFFKQLASTSHCVSTADNGNDGNGKQDGTAVERYTMKRTTLNQSHCLLLSSMLLLLKE